MCARGVLTQHDTYALLAQVTWTCVWSVPTDESNSKAALKHKLDAYQPSTKLPNFALPSVQESYSRTRVQQLVGGIHSFPPPALIPRPLLRGATAHPDAFSGSGSFRLRTPSPRQELASTAGPSYATTFLARMESENPWLSRDPRDRLPARLPGLRREEQRRPKTMEEPNNSNLAREAPVLLPELSPRRSRVAKGGSSQSPRRESAETDAFQSESEGLYNP
jgi:hypothetical protein